MNFGFIIHIKIDDVYKDIANDVKKRFDTSKYDVDKPFSKGRISGVIRLMKYELGRKIMTKISNAQTKRLFLLKV